MKEEIDKKIEEIEERLKTADSYYAFLNKEEEKKLEFLKRLRWALE